MKNSIYLILVLIILGGGYLLYSNSVETDKSDGGELATFADRDIGVQFRYKPEPEGYVLEDVTSKVRSEIAVDTEGSEVVKAYLLINARDKAELEASTEAREGPPTMNLMVFKNSRNLSLSQWVSTFPQLSNAALLVGDINRDAVFGGANAVVYRTDGLYLTENVVIANGEFIFHFTGTFLEEGSVIHQDFWVLIDSIEFIPL